MKKVAAKIIMFLLLIVVYLIFLCKLVELNYEVTSGMLCLVGNCLIIFLIGRFVEWLFTDKTSDLPTNCVD